MTKTMFFEQALPTATEFSRHHHRLNIAQYHQSLNFHHTCRPTHPSHGIYEHDGLNILAFRQMLSVQWINPWHGNNTHGILRIRVGVHHMLAPLTLL
jgi:hypothetical protein